MSDKNNKSRKCNNNTNLIIEEQKNGTKQSTIKGIPIAIQNEIKNIVISKFIDQIQILVKELELYKKENRVIKNDLTYVLKRILNNQIEYNPLANFNHSQFNNSINNSSMYFNKSNRSFLSSEKLNTVNNFNKSKMSSNKSINEETLNSSPYHLNKNKYNNIDVKINNYLNSLYKHNFVDNNILGSQGNYRLNNSKIIYDELFKKNTYKHNHSQKNIKSPERNTINEDDENEKLNKNMNIQTIVEDNKVLKVKRNKKKNSINLKNKNINSNYQKYGGFSLGTTTLNSNDKKYNESNRVFNKKRSVGSKRTMCSNRSPFLANKF